MPLKFQIVTTGRLELDARELVRRTSDAAIETMRESLIGGVNPVDGTPRPENSAGRPEGFRTGTLANNLHRTVVTGSASSASTTIRPPQSRAGWVASRGDVMVANGRVGEAIQVAADEYTAEVSG